MQFLWWEHSFSAEVIRVLTWRSEAGLCFYLSKWKFVYWTRDKAGAWLALPSLNLTKKKKQICARGHRPTACQDQWDGSTYQTTWGCIGCNAGLFFKRAASTFTGWTTWDQVGSRGTAPSKRPDKAERHRRNGNFDFDGQRRGEIFWTVGWVGSRCNASFCVLFCDAQIPMNRHYYWYYQFPHAIRLIVTGLDCIPDGINGHWRWCTTLSIYRRLAVVRYFSIRVRRNLFQQDGNLARPSPYPSTSVVPLWNIFGAYVLVIFSSKARWNCWWLPHTYIQMVQREASDRVYGRISTYCHPSSTGCVVYDFCTRCNDRSNPWTL